MVMSSPTRNPAVSATVKTTLPDEASLNATVNVVLFCTARLMVAPL
jgi:hypothetical protein